VPFLLRKIRRAKWHQLGHTDIPWLGEDDIQADALGDLKTERNALSVWWIMDDMSNFHRIAAAIMASGETFASLDYALLDKDEVENAGIQIDENSEGATTPDGEVNQSWHYHFTELSLAKILILVKMIKSDVSSNFSERRIKEKCIGTCIAQGIELCQIDRNKVEEGVINKLIKRRYLPT